MLCVSSIKTVKTKPIKALNNAVLWIMPNSEQRRALNNARRWTTQSSEQRRTLNNAELWTTPKSEQRRTPNDAVLWTTPNSEQRRTLNIAGLWTTPNPQQRQTRNPKQQRAGVVLGLALNNAKPTDTRAPHRAIYFNYHTKQLDSNQPSKQPTTTN
jgi:hypothetical protein